jgi:hypothetical protein
MRRASRKLGAPHLTDSEKDSLSVPSKVANLVVSKYNRRHEYGLSLFTSRASKVELWRTLGGTVLVKVTFCVGLQGDWQHWIYRTLASNLDFVSSSGIDYFQDGVEQSLLDAIGDGVMAKSASSQRAMSLFGSPPNTEHIFLAQSHYAAKPANIVFNEIFLPDISSKIKSFMDIVPLDSRRYVFVAQPLHWMLKRYKHPLFHKSISDIGWEGSYEISWLDVVRRVLATDEHCDVCVLDGRQLPLTLGATYRYIFDVPKKLSVEGERDWWLTFLKNEKLTPASQKNGKMWTRNSEIRLMKSKARSMSFREVLISQSWDQDILEILENRFEDDLRRLRNLGRVKVI